MSALEAASAAQRLQADILRTLLKRVLPALAEQLVVKNEVILRDYKLVWTPVFPPVTRHFALDSDD